MDELSQPWAHQHRQGQSFVWEGQTAGSHHSLTHTHHKQTHAHTLHANDKFPGSLMAVVSELPQKKSNAQMHPFKVITPVTPATNIKSLGMEEKAV